MSEMEIAAIDKAANAFDELAKHFRFMRSMGEKPKAFTLEVGYCNRRAKELRDLLAA